MSITERLTKILQEYRGDDSQLTPTTTFDQLDFDSLDKAELMMRVEDEFRIMFDDTFNANNVEELVGQIEKLMK